MIISIIKSIASDMGIAFYFGRDDFQNLIADEQTLPAIYLDQPITNDYNLNQSGYMSATYPVKLLFLYKSELDYTPTQHDTNCIQPAEAKIREFINRAELVASIDSLTSIKSYEFINLFDCNVSGKGLDVTIQVNNSYSTCADAGLDLTKGIVTNSDSSYNNEVGMGNTLTLADITITKADATTVSYPSAKNINLSDYQSGIAYQRPLLTGQTTSYRTGDDAWNVANNPYSAAPANPTHIATLVDFTTLAENNAFGNTNRFTDDAGGQTYANSYIIDHHTGIGWYRNTTNSTNWTDSIDAAETSTLLGFTNWKIPNITELLSICDYGLLRSLDYGIFSVLANNIVLWSSTTDEVNTSLAKGVITSLSTSTLVATSRDKTLATSFYSRIICRNHY